MLLQFKIIKKKIHFINCAAYFQLRENALLTLMYGLMTFPSTEFPISKLSHNIMAAAVREPKRR